MAHRGGLFACWVAVGAVGVTSTAGANAQGIDLSTLVSSLDLTERGAAMWLARLEANGTGPAAERLLAVTATGERLMERDGGQSSVSVGVEMDKLLLQQDRVVVLIHNHASNVGLSAADIGQLAKAGVAAIVAIGHDRSVFVAAPGRRMDPDHVEDRQYAQASAEVSRRLRKDWPMNHIPFAVADAHLSHLVAQALAQIGVIDYWFVLRGTSRESYERARLVFGQVVAGTTAQLKQRGPQKSHIRSPERTSNCQVRPPTSVEAP